MNVIGHLINCNIGHSEMKGDDLSINEYQKLPPLSYKQNM